MTQDQAKRTPSGPGSTSAPFATSLRTRSQDRDPLVPESRKPMSGPNSRPENQTHGVEWLRFQGHPGRNAARRMPLPMSLANLKRVFAEAKWSEAKEWSYSRINHKKYRPGKKQLLGPAVARIKRLASRFYQLEAGHTLTGGYLYQVTNSRSSAQCWWCERCNTKQTREHLFKKSRHG